MSSKKFQEFIDKENIKIKIIESREKTHTAQQAAEVHNVPIGNIVKSILVKIDNEFILFLVPGDKRIDLEEKKKLFNTNECRIANANEVKEVTDYSIGGVPPFGHKEKIKTYIEEGFDRNKSLLAAAGSPNSMFKISFRKLEKIISKPHAKFNLEN